MRWALYIGSAPIICTAILAFGYWRATSRVHIHIGLVSAQSGTNSAPVFNAELVLRDPAGNELARGRSDDRFGIVRFAHPQFGSCEREENAASAEGRPKWDDCISKKFRWQAAWAPRVSQVDIGFEGCQLFGIPLKLAGRRDDWWLWWVPLPHIGGDPLTEFSARISVLTGPCQAAVPAPTTECRLRRGRRSAA